MHVFVQQIEMYEMRLFTRIWESEKEVKMLGDFTELIMAILSAKINLPLTKMCVDKNELHISYKI